MRAKHADVKSSLISDTGSRFNVHGIVSFINEGMGAVAKEDKFHITYDWVEIIFAEFLKTCLIPFIVKLSNMEISQNGNSYVTFTMRVTQSVITKVYWQHSDVLKILKFWTSKSLNEYKYLIIPHHFRTRVLFLLTDKIGSSKIYGNGLPTVLMVNFYRYLSQFHNHKFPPKYSQSIITGLASNEIGNRVMKEYFRSNYDEIIQK